MASYSVCISGEVIRKSELALSIATGIFHTVARRRSAFTSGSCGWASIGSQKKISTSISPCAIMAPICWSPPSGAKHLPYRPVQIFFQHFPRSACCNQFMLCQHSLIKFRPFQKILFFMVVRYQCNTFPDF